MAYSQTPSGAAPGTHRKLARSSTGLLIASVFTVAAYMATTILTARVLGPSGRGELTLLTTISTLAVTLSGLGLGAAAAYLMARGDLPRPVVLANSIVLGFLLGAVVVAGGYIAVVFGHVKLRGVPQTDLLIVLLMIPFTLVLTNIQAAFQGLQRFLEYNLISVAQATLPFLLIGLAFLVFSTDVREAIIGTVASPVILAALFLLIAGGAIGLRWRLDRSFTRAAFSYGMRAYLANVLGLLGYRLDVFVVNHDRGNTAVGLYGIAVGIAERLWMPSQAVSTALFPRIAEERDENVRRGITPLVARNTFWLTALLALPLYLLSGAIVNLLFGSAFAHSAVALQAILPGIVAFSAARVLSSDLTGRGRPGLMSILTGVSVAVNFGLNLILVPRYGIVGASLASTFSYSLLLLLTLAAYCRLAKVSVRTVLVPTREDGAAYLRLFRRLLKRPTA